jgi:dihydroflavonol-4-reductase
MNLVTGATGLLGAHIMLELLRKGEKVRGLHRGSGNKQIVQSIFHHYSESAGLFEKIEWVEGDILDIHSLLKAMEGCTGVFHCAAVVSYHSADRDLMYTVNVEGTANVVNVALEKGDIRLCFVSSIAALGKAKNHDWIDESTEWIDSPFNTHYGISKNLGEMEVWRGIQEGLQGFVINPGFIIGPGNFDRSSASVFRKMNEGLSYYPPGGTGFVSATDCASISVDLMLNGAHSERYIVVAENCSMKDVFQKIALSLGKQKPQKEATKTILQLARIAEWVKEKVTRKKALITKESVKNASIQFYYHNEKVIAAVNRNFQPVHQAIENTASFFKKTQH